MAKNNQNNSSKTGNISYSSIDTQKELRIQKLLKLKELGYNPFTPDSKRDATLGFVNFWFNLIHKFDIQKIAEDLDNSTLDYFLTDALFPESLVQMLENKIYLKNISKELNFDSDEFENEFEREILDEARNLLPDLSKFTEDTKFKLKDELIGAKENDLGDISEDEIIDLKLKPNQKITLAGRIKSKRVSGKIAFGSIEDESLPEGFQFIFKKDSLPEYRIWELNFRNEKQIKYLDSILNGTKTIETRALNPEEPDRFFGDIKVGDFVKLNNILNNASYYFEVIKPVIFSNLENAFQLNFDFSKISSEFNSKTTLEEIQQNYIQNLGQNYYQKIQDNGFIALELEANVPELNFDHFKELFDEGDYIQATGRLDYSNTGQPSLFVEEFTILTKALRPLPDVLDYENIEARYLDRVADIKMNTKDANGLSVRDIIRAKAKYWQIWREEMLSEGFLEVECPIFEAVPGGADAKPFTTFYNELDQEMYLRIALELPLKKLIAGGFEKVFEIGRQFRNEGSDPTHLQEYTQIEWYWAYSNYYDAMPFTTRIYRRIAQEILGTLEQIDYLGNKINWGNWCSETEAKKNGWKLIEGWPAIPYFEAVRYFSKGTVDLEGKNYDELLKLADKHKIEIETGTSISNLIDKIYKKVARPFMVNPMFLIEQPVELEPLAKRDPKNPNLVHRWQIIAGGQELGKCFSELNDPIDQYQRFEEQQKARDAGDEEAQFMNTDYVKALEYGLPPLSGFGMSERLVSFLLGKHIRECVTFPHIRSKEEISNAKSKETKVAHSVILNTNEIPMWSKMNAAAHLSASFAARIGSKLIWMDSSTTLDGEKIPMNIQHAILMKQTKERSKLLELKQAAEKQDLIVSVFTEEMRDSSNDAKVKEWQESKNADQIGYLGVLIFGEKSKVEKLTKEFKLME